LAGAKLDRIVKAPEGYRDWTGPVLAKCDYHLCTDVEPDSKQGE
jgi:hypothetical protein